MGWSVSGDRRGRRGDLRSGWRRAKEGAGGEGGVDRKRKIADHFHLDWWPATFPWNLTSGLQTWVFLCVCSCLCVFLCVCVPAEVEELVLGFWSIFKVRKSTETQHEAKYEAKCFIGSQSDGDSNKREQDPRIRLEFFSGHSSYISKPYQFCNFAMVQNCLSQMHYAFLILLVSLSRGFRLQLHRKLYYFLGLLCPWRPAALDSWGRVVNLFNDIWAL